MTVSFLEEIICHSKSLEEILLEIGSTLTGFMLILLSQRDSRLEFI
jgi:hypothetical protein